MSEPALAVAFRAPPLASTPFTRMFLQGGTASKRAIVGAVATQTDTKQQRTGFRVCYALLKARVTTTPRTLRRAEAHLIGTLMRAVGVRAARRAYRRLRGRQGFVGTAKRVAHQAVRVGVRARLLAQRVASLGEQMWVLGSRV